MATQLVLDQVPAQMQGRKRKGKPDLRVIYYGALSAARMSDDDDKALLPAKRPVQFAVYAL